jgi:hypothetical protein
MMPPKQRHTPHSLTAVVATSSSFYTTVFQATRLHFLFLPFSVWCSEIQNKRLLHLFRPHPVQTRQPHSIFPSNTFLTMAANTDAQWNAMTKIVNDFYKRNDCSKYLGKSWLLRLWI